MPPQVFISYSAKDGELARQLYSFLQMAGAEPFLAELDLKPGVKWKKEILEALRNAPWVLFLATPNSCPSQAVAHEIGASLVLNKKLIPIMYRVSPKDLPPWVDDTQAIDLRDTNGIRQLITGIGTTVKSDKFWTGVLVGGLIFLSLWALASR